MLAQRTPVKAAFWTTGLDRTLEERRIELPKRSEEAMVGLCAMELGEGRKQCSAVLLDEARLKGGGKLLELSARKSQTLGELSDVTILHPA